MPPSMSPLSEITLRVLYLLFTSVQHNIVVIYSIVCFSNRSRIINIIYNAIPSLIGLVLCIMKRMMILSQ